MIRTLLCLLLVNYSSAFSASIAAKPSIYDGLDSTPLLRAADGESTLLTSQWRQNTPFGIADETAVCAFLRYVRPYFLEPSFSLSGLKAYFYCVLQIDTLGDSYAGSMHLNSVM